MILQATLITGIIVGVICLLAAVHNHIKYQNFGLGGAVLVAFGSMLLGLSVWQSVELSIDSEGRITAKYKQQQDIGAEAADRNSQFAELKLKLAEISENIGSLNSSIPNASLPQSQIEARKKIEKQFERNSKYSVLVFNKQEQEQEQAAQNISKALLEAGYKSSATPTDLKESKRQLESNESWVIYTERGKEILSEVKQVLSKSANNIRFVYEPNPSKLRRGDIQVLLF